MGNYNNWAIDPWDDDTQYYIHVQSLHYSGTYDDLYAAENENFPPTSSTRVFMDLPLAVDISDLSGSMPISIYDVTAASTLSRTSGAPSSGEFRIVTNVDSKARQKIELHTSALGHKIGYDYYGLGGVLSEDAVNSLVKGVTTVVIASSNSSDEAKTAVDFIIDVSDDAGAKINTIATGLSNGGTIKALSGTYNVSTIITLDDNVNLIGENRNTQFIKSSNIANVINLSSCGNNIIKDLLVNGVKASYTGTNYHGIVGNGEETQVFDNVSSIANDDYGFYDCFNVRNCYSSSNSSGFYTCYFVTACLAKSNTGTGFYDCNWISSCYSLSNATGFSNCDEISSSIAWSNSAAGFDTCNNISACNSVDNGTAGFDTCNNISACKAYSNTGKGFFNSFQISSCESNTNGSNGFSDCDQLTGCISSNDVTFSFNACANISGSRAFSSTGIGFHDCEQVSGCQSDSNTTHGFDGCEQVSSCYATSNGSNGFNSCRTMSACKAYANTADGFQASYELSSCFSDLNTNGYDTCLFISSCVATSNTSVGFTACKLISSSHSVNNGTYGFSNCKTMGFNWSLTNTTANYNTSYADSGTTWAVADTYQGGYNY